MKTLIAFAFLAFIGCRTNNTQQKNDINKTIEIQNRHTEELMKISGVTGVGTSDSGNAIVIFTNNDSVAAKIPSTIEGTPTRIITTGDIIIANPDNGDRAEGKGGQHIESMAAYRTPMYSGVSIGRNAECNSGTSACVVTDNATHTHKYILSANHCIAGSNLGVIGEAIVQPGRYDETYRCGTGEPVATLSKFIPVNFNYASVSNYVDCAIAEINPGINAVTQTTQYGVGNYIPTNKITIATIGLPVKKIGRTTGLTTGTVGAVNVTSYVGYIVNGAIKFARFAGCIYISSTTFSKAGDSGALIVDTLNNPVGLLIAGTSSFTLATPIKTVLDSLHVSIVTP